MKHMSVVRAVEENLDVPRVMFARYLVDHHRLSNDAPGYNGVVPLPPRPILPPRVPRQDAPDSRLWKHSRE